MDPNKKIIIMNPNKKIIIMDPNKKPGGEGSSRSCFL
jgi:hypothetical protein